MNEKIINLNNLPIGQRVFMKGDMANLEGYGKIVNRLEFKEFGIYYDIKLDDGREFRRVPARSFDSEYSWVLIDTNDFNKWFSLFLEEQELSNAIFEFEDAHQWHFFPIGVISEYLATAPPEIQQKVKDKLVQIDFSKGDVRLFLQFIAKGITTDFKL